MNRQALLCRTILEYPDITQRDLAEKLDVSLGTANSLIKECTNLGYIAQDQHHLRCLTEEGREFLAPFKVDGALFIAAGFGSRFVPLTFEMPKGLLEVQGERMIERQICQLKEVGISDITIVVGYLKEKFEYLIDKYDVTLLYNPEYACKNTLATIYHARKVLEGRNMYLLSSDNWMQKNMFHTYEWGPWYSSVHIPGETSEWCLSYNKRGLITDVVIGGRDAWVMYGPAYFSKEFSASFLPVLEEYYHQPGTESFYWEQVYMDLIHGNTPKHLFSSNQEQRQTQQVQRQTQQVQPQTQQNQSQTQQDQPQTQQNQPQAQQKPLSIPALYINRQPENQVYEFENLEELRRFDSQYNNRSNNQAMELVASVFQVPESEITHIRCLKAGMTNKSFLFKIHNRSYICRIPGPGTEQLINRKEEKAVYDTVAPLEITEHVLYFNGETGYKISAFYENARTADSQNHEDMAQSMKLLRRLHQAALSVDHAFDLKNRIQFYENLCLSHGGIPFEDYSEVRGWMDRLLMELQHKNRPQTLCHIDPVVDNILILEDGSFKLIDWEYAGMADPILDIAMCSIYSYYSFDEGLSLLEMYLERKPTEEETFVLIASMALSGFLWSLWAIYKSNLGEEFGEYTITMYRYGKQGYRRLRPHLYLLEK